MVPLIGVVAAASLGYVFRRGFFGDGSSNDGRNVEDAVTLVVTEESCEVPGEGADPAKASPLEVRAQCENAKKCHEEECNIQSKDFEERDEIGNPGGECPVQSTGLSPVIIILDDPAASEKRSASDSDVLDAEFNLRKMDSGEHSGIVRRLIASFEEDSVIGDLCSLDLILTKRTKSPTAEGSGRGELREYLGDFDLDLGAPNENAISRVLSSETLERLAPSNVASEDGVQGDAKGDDTSNHGGWVMQDLPEAEQTGGSQTDWWEVGGEVAELHIGQERGEDDEYGLRCLRSGDDGVEVEDINERDVVCVEETPVATCTSNPRHTDIATSYECADFRSAPESSSVHILMKNQHNRVRAEEDWVTVLQQQRIALKADTRRQIVELEENWRRKLDSERESLLKEIADLKGAMHKKGHTEAPAWEDENLVEKVLLQQEIALEDESRKNRAQAESESEFLRRAMVLQQRVQHESGPTQMTESAESDKKQELLILDDGDDLVGDMKSDREEKLDNESVTSRTGSICESDFLHRAMVLQQRVQHVPSEVPDDGHGMTIWSDEHDLVGEEGSDQEERIRNESCTNSSQAGCQSEVLHRAMLLQERIQHESVSVEVPNIVEADNKNESTMWNDGRQLVGQAGSEEADCLVDERQISEADSGGLEVLETALLLRERVLESTIDEMEYAKAAADDAWMWDLEVGSDEEAEAVHLKQALEVQKLVLEEEHRRKLKCKEEENTAIINQMRIEWEETLSWEIKHVRESLHQEWDRRLVEDVRRDPASTSGEVEGAKLQIEEALKAQRLALEADHNRLVDEIREENVASLEAERKQWEHVKAEWEERLQEEREAYMVESKQELEQALYLQRLVLDEEHLKVVQDAREQDLQKDRELWDEALEGEIERVRGMLQMEWEDRLQQEKAALKVRHEAESSRHLELALEAQRLTLDAEYARMMEERKEKEDMKWMRKLEMEREALLSMAKKIVAQERENYKVTIEAEWIAKLAEERSHRQQVEQEIAREQRKLDEKLRKETARLELRATSLENKEMQVQHWRVEADKLRSELVAACSQQESSHGYHISRETLLKAPESDHFNEANFKRWISLRLGNNERTVYWYTTGELYSYPQGELLVRVEGLDVTRAIMVGPNCVHQVSRKLFVFKDKDTHDVLTEYHGKHVAPVVYPYQRIAYTLQGNNLMTEASSHPGHQLTTLRGNVVSIRHLTGTTKLVFICPVFLNLHTTKGKYQSYENYDYFMDKADEEHSNHCSMVRFGATPPFSDNAVMHLSGWRLDHFDELPKSIRDYVATQGPEWKEAPCD